MTASSFTSKIEGYIFNTQNFFYQIDCDVSQAVKKKKYCEFCVESVFAFPPVISLFFGVQSKSFYVSGRKVM